MAKAELGEKQVCPNCASKFYDLRKRPAVCPKCATAFDPSDEQIKIKRVRSSKAPVYETDYEDEEEDTKAKGARADADADDELGEEVEEAPELDSEAVDAPEDVAADDDDEGAVSPDKLPAGFSEADEDAELVDEAVGDDDDDGVPLLEDDEEFDEELGEAAADDEEDR